MYAVIALALFLLQVGPRTLTVTTPSGTATLPNAFNVNAAAPQLTSINPASAAQGATVSGNLTGSNLATVTSVTFSGTGVGAVIGTPTFNAIPITITIAANAATGPRNVTVNGPGGVTTLTAAFTIQFPAPTITGITPNSGVQGTVVNATITGTNLLGVTNVSLGQGVTVTINPGGTATSIPVTITIDSPIAYAPCLDQPLYRQTLTGYSAGCMSPFLYLALGNGMTQQEALNSAKFNTALRLKPPGGA